MKINFEDRGYQGSRIQDIPVGTVFSLYNVPALRTDDGFVYLDNSTQHSLGIDTTSDIEELLITVFYDATLNLKLRS